ASAPKIQNVDFFRASSGVRGFAIADRLGDSHPNVHQAEPADQAAYKILHEEFPDLRVSQQQRVLRPDAGPGKRGEDYAHLQAEQHKYHQPNALYPEMRPFWRQRGWHHQHGAAAIQPITILRLLRKSTHDSRLVQRSSSE